MSDYVDGGSYIEVYPIETIDRCIRMNYGANSWPVSEDTGDWFSEGGVKSISMLMAEDVDDDDTSDVQARYDFNANAVVSGGDVVYSDDFPTMSAAAQYSIGLGRYFADNAFLAWNINKFASENFVRAEFVADLSAVNSNLGGPQDEATNTVIRFDILPVSTFGSDYWDYRGSHTDTVGGSARYSFAVVESGSLADFYDSSRVAIPLPIVPAGIFGFRIAVYMRDGSDPVNNNNVAFLCDASSVSGIDNDKQVGGEWHEAIIFDMPCIRLWRSDEVAVSAPEAQLDLNISLDATINADLIFHSARRRRNRHRR